MAKEGNNKRKPPQTKQKGSNKNHIFIYVALAVAVILFGVYFHQSEESDQEFSPSDYSIREKRGEKSFFINQRLKKLAHPDVGKYTQRNLSDTIDQFWKINENSITQVSYLFHEFSKVQMDVKIHFEGSVQYKRPDLSLINDNEYCLKSNIYHLQHPEAIFDNYFFFSDFGGEELPREAVKSFGYDLLPNISQSMPREQATKRSTALPLEISLIHSRISRLHHYHQFNQHLFCTFQSANHIPGKWSITGKDLVIDNYRLYEQKKFVDTKKCSQFITFMPESFRLYDTQECRKFFNYLDSKEYKDIITRDGIAFILKEGRDIHRGEGINLVSPSYQKQIQDKYQNGKLCDSVKDVLQVQRYINNPILHEGKKLEVRIYFFIASTNPLIIYAQKLALIKKCAVEYDKHDYSAASHICNTSISKTIIDDFVVEFALEGLQDYLLKTGFTTDKDWLEKQIYPQIYQAITHLVRAGSHDFLIDSRVNENFATDFLIDDQSKVWFLENNPNPQVLRSSVKRTMRHYVMFGDLFQIQFAYLRSRAKRLHELAKSMAETIEKGNEIDKIEGKKLFAKANTNYLEKEFESQIRKDSSYIKIFDDNLIGEDKFMGNLPRDCLYQD